MRGAGSISLYHVDVLSESSSTHLDQSRRPYLDFPAKMESAEIGWRKNILDRITNKKTAFVGKEGFLNSLSKLSIISLTRKTGCNPPYAVKKVISGTQTHPENQDFTSRKILERYAQTQQRQKGIFRYHFLPSDPFHAINWRVTEPLKKFIDLNLPQKEVTRKKLVLLMVVPVASFQPSYVGGWRRGSVKMVPPSWSHVFDRGSTRDEMKIISHYLT